MLSFFVILGFSSAVLGFTALSPPNCNIPNFTNGPIIVIPPGLDWGYAGMEPTNGTSFCIGLGNEKPDRFEIYANIDLGTGGCTMNGNKCGDANLRSKIVAVLQTVPASMTADAVAGHLQRIMGRNNWLFVVMANPTGDITYYCPGHPNYCLISAVDYPQVPIKFVAAMQIKVV